MRRIAVFCKARFAPIALQFGLLLGCLVSLSAGVAQADVVALGGLEAYDSNFKDVTLQTTVGTWTKSDNPNPVVNQGELVTSGAFGSFAPRSGNVFLDLRTENQYVTGDDGADYNYALNQADFGGLDPSSVSNGTVELSYFICPDTFSNDIPGFVPEGIYQTTHLRNGNGDILASIGMYSLGTQNSPEVHYSVDGVNWLSTGLEASNGDWTEVELLIDLDAQTSRVGFTDLNSNVFDSGDLAWSSGITDASVQTLNFQMDDGVGKNFFDDFAFTVTPAAIPEPSGAFVISGSL